jgi:hypothetical protein
LKGSSGASIDDSRQILEQVAPDANRAVAPVM